MGNSASTEDREAVMEYMKFCTYVIDKEIQRFSLDFNVYKFYVAQQLRALDVNYDIPYHRCAFMYLYSLGSIHFFKACMNKFILECPEFKKLLSKWTADLNASICSLSCGPGLDYLSFMLALTDPITSSLFKNVTILSKFDSWKSTVDIVADALEEEILFKCGIGKILNFKNIEVVESNFLTSISAKGLEALQNSSVILMVKTLNLIDPETDEKEMIKTKLLELISALKSESTIFFVDTKLSLSLFLTVLSKFDGIFLFKPEHLSFRAVVKFLEEYEEKHGCLPQVRNKKSFFVWQKMSYLEPDTNVNKSHVNHPTDVKEISKNSLEKSLNENDDFLNITKTHEDLILPSNKDLQCYDVDNISISSPLIDSNKSSVSNVGELVSLNPCFVSTPKQLEIKKSASNQNLVSTQSIQEHTQINFDEKSCLFHSLNKSSNIDNSFFQGSSKNLSFLGESDFLQSSLHSSSIEETFQHNVNKKKISAIKKNDASKINQASKPTSKSKATQTELLHSASNSSPVKGLTERVKQLVSSLENEVQKNIPSGPVNIQFPASPNKNSNYSYCSTNCSNDSEADNKPQYCDGYRTERENPIRCCNYGNCCAVRHMMHGCEMHGCQSCVHRCNINPHRPFCGSSIGSISTSLAQPQIVIPLQNVSDDLLLQLISAAKSGSKPQ